MALAAATSSMGCAAAPAVTANSPTRAIRGIAARSWNSSTANARRPWRRASSPFSSSTCRAKAVDESDSASPANRAACQARPNASAAAASAAPVSATCALPRPKIAERMAHRRRGRSSRPITNRSMMTPNSAKCSTDSTSPTRRRPAGPMSTPTSRYPSTLPTRRSFASGAATTAAARNRATCSGSRCAFRLTTSLASLYRTHTTAKSRASNLDRRCTRFASSHSLGHSLGRTWMLIAARSPPKRGMLARRRCTILCVIRRNGRWRDPTPSADGPEARACARRRSSAEPVGGCQSGSDARSSASRGTHRHQTLAHSANGGAARGRRFRQPPHGRAARLRLGRGVRRHAHARAGFGQMDPPGLRGGATLRDGRARCRRRPAAHPARFPRVIQVRPSSDRAVRAEGEQCSGPRPREVHALRQVPDSLAPDQVRGSTCGMTGSHADCVAYLRRQKKAVAAQ